MSRCRGQWLRLLSLLVGFPILTAGADGGPSQTPSAADLRYLEPGFKALEVLEDLKVVHERRGADCMSAIGHEKFCSCLNNSLSLDLSFPEYVVLVTSLEGDTAALPLAPEKHRFRDEARHLRDVCVNKAFPGDRVDP